MPITVNAMSINPIDAFDGISGIINAFTAAKWALITPIITIMGLLFRLLYIVSNRKVPFHWTIRIGVLSSIFFTQFVLFLMVLVQFSDLFEEIGDYFG